MRQENKRKRMGQAAALLLSAATAAALLLTAGAFADRPLQMPERLQEQDTETGPEQLAWWGSLYPRLCLKDAMRLVGEPQGQEGEIPVKITWKCRELF